MKYIHFLLCSVLIIITSFCGNDSGTGRMQLAISTEDGAETIESIIAKDPSYAATPTWLNQLHVMIHNDDPTRGSLLLNELYPASALRNGEYLEIDVPTGTNLYVSVNAIDKNNVIQYSGIAGPIAIDQNADITVPIAMRKMLSEMVKNKNLTLSLKLASNLQSSFHEEMNRFGTVNVYAHIYTCAVKIGNEWIPTNPDNGVDYSVGGSYSSNSQWTGGTFFSNMLQFIAIHVEDSAQGVIFYGVRAYDSRWSTENPLTVYMYYPSKLVVTLVGSSLPTTAKVQMFVNNDWRDLYVSNTTNSNFQPNATNPVVLDAPSGETWFTSAPVQTRTIKVKRDTGNAWTDWGSPQSFEVDWGINRVTIYGP